MSTVHSGDFWKHRNWCGSIPDHKFDKCVYNHNARNQSYFRAPCCGRYVRFLTNKKSCKKCVYIACRQHLRDLKDNKDADVLSHGLELEPQVFNTTHNLKLDDEQFKCILHTIEQLPNSLGDAVDAVQSHLAALVAPLGDTIVKFVAKITVALALIYRISDDVIAVVLAIVQFLLSLNIDINVVNSFKDFCVNMYSRLTPHTYGVEEIFSVVGFFLSVLTLGRGPSIETLLSFYKNVCTVKYFSTTIKSVYDVIKSCIVAAVDFVSSIFLGHGFEWTGEEPYNYIVGWCDQVDELYVKHTKSEWDEEMLSQLDFLHDRMTSITNHWRFSKPPVTVQSIFLAHSNIVRKLFDEVAILGTRQVPRIEPTFVMLQGKSAVGKSLITPLLASELISKCGIARDGKVYSSYVYNRCVETEFWDGYSGQKVIVYDDFGQLYDSASKPNLELMEVLRLGNSAPFFVNMARLEAKGRTRIACDFVLMSCNVAPTTATVQSLQEPNAVMRRIDYMIEVGVKPEFMKDGKIDMDGIRTRHMSELCGCSLPAYSDMCVAHYSFTVKTWSGSGWINTKTGASYDDIILLISEAHNKRREMSAKRIQAINSRLKTQSVDLTPHSGGNALPIPYDVNSFKELCDVKRKFLDVCEYRDWLEKTALTDFAYLYNCPVAEGDDMMMEVVSQMLHDELKYLHGMDSSWDSHAYNYRRTVKYTNFLLDFSRQSMSDIKETLVAGRRLIAYHVLQRWMDELLVYVGTFAKSSHIDPLNGPGRQIYGMVAAAEARLEYGAVAAHNDGKALICYLEQHAEIFFNLLDSPEEELNMALDLAYLNNDLAMEIDLEPQVGADEIIEGVKRGDDHIVKCVLAWVAKLPSSQDSDWSLLVDEIKNDQWTPSMLEQLSEETLTPLPEVELKSEVATKLARVKELVMKKYSSLKEHPFMVLFGLLGASAVASLFYGFFRHFVKDDSPQAAPVGDMVNIRSVGGLIKKSYVKHPAIKVDDTDKELYVRIDKGRFLAESRNDSSETSSRRDSKQSVHSYDSWYRYNPKRWNKEIHLETHSLEDPSLEDIEKICLKNMVALLRPGQDEYRCLGHGIMITGRVMLTFKHWWGLPDQEFVLRRALTKNNFFFNRSEVMTYPITNGEVAVDAMLVVLPKRFPLARDIVDHFAPANDVNETHYRARLISMRKFVDEAIVRISSGDAIAKDELLRYELGGAGTGCWYYVRNHYTHNIDAYKGDCGALLVQANTHKRAKILGLHVAGGHETLTRSVYNVACAVNQEMLRAALSHINATHKLSPSVEIDGVNLDVAAIEPQVDGFDVVGVVDKGITDMKQSCIVASPLHGKLGPSTMAPALLYGSVDGEDVKVTAAKKNLPIDSVALNPAFLGPAVAQAKIMFCRNKTRVPRLLTLDEAAFGIEGDQYVESLNANSSCGYPWVLTTRRRGKRDHLDMDLKVISSVMKSACSLRLQKAKVGIRSTTLFSDHLKDERRKKAGFKFLRPRLFSGGPLDYTLVFRQYFGDFVAQVMQNRIRNTVAVGINVHDGEWTYLAGELLTKGNNILAGDFANYDGTLNAQIMWCVLDVIQHWYGGSDEEAFLVREVLWAEIVNSVHIFRNAVYQFDHGNPSGNPMTTIVNSVYQYIAWCYIAQVAGYRLCDFVNKTTLVTYGDDNIMSVIDQFMDPGALVHAFNTIGMTLTSEDKDEDFGYKKLSEVSFLKRKFDFNETVGRYLAPLPKEVLREMLYWYKKPNNWNEVGPDIVECCIRELAHHDDETAGVMTAAVLDVVVESGLEIKAMPSIAELRMAMLEPDYIYYNLF